MILCSRLGKVTEYSYLLSNKYLQSPYCMFELFELWRNSRKDKIDFTGKIRVFNIDGTKVETPENG